MAYPSGWLRHPEEKKMVCYNIRIIKKMQAFAVDPRQVNHVPSAEHEAHFKFTSDARVKSLYFICPYLALFITVNITRVCSNQNENLLRAIGIQNKAEMRYLYVNDVSSLVDLEVRRQWHRSMFAESPAKHVPRTTPVTLCCSSSWLLQGTNNVIEGNIMIMMPHAFHFDGQLYHMPTKYLK